MKRVLQSRPVSSLLARRSTTPLHTTTSEATPSSNNPITAISHRSFIKQRSQIKTTFVNNYHNKARSAVADIIPLSDRFRPHGPSGAGAVRIAVSDTAVDLMSDSTGRRFASTTDKAGGHDRDTRTKGRPSESRIGSEGGHEISSDPSSSTLSSLTPKKKRGKRLVPIERHYNTRSSKGKSCSKVDKLEREFVLDCGLRDGATAPTGSRGGASKRHQTHVEATGFEHEKELNRFTLNLRNNQKARIDYRILQRRSPDQGQPVVIELYHSEVPEQLRGRGIGKALASGALDCIESNKWRVVVTCSYLNEYMNEHAKEAHKRLRY